jgi:hypothetical protein
MSEPKRGKRKKSSSRAAERPARRARRFEAQASTLGQTALVLICTGAGLLGAGAYGQFMRQAPLEFAPVLLIGGIVVLVFGWQQASKQTPPVLVGDPGVAAEEGDPLRWLPWSRVESVTFEKNVVEARGDGRTISVPVEAHPQAAAWVVREALERVPAKVKVAEADRAKLSADEGAGEVREFGPAQVAGAHCRNSDKVIAFDEDARLCPKCGEVYHKDEVPEECLACEADLTALQGAAAKA